MYGGKREDDNNWEKGGKKLKVLWQSQKVFIMGNFSFWQNVLKITFVYRGFRKALMYGGMGEDDNNWEKGGTQIKVLWQSQKVFIMSNCSFWHNFLKITSVCKGFRKASFMGGKRRGCQVIWYCIERREVNNFSFCKKVFKMPLAAKALDMRLLCTKRVKYCGVDWEKEKIFNILKNIKAKKESVHYEQFLLLSEC